MVSFADLMPFVSVVLLWFASTALIMWLAHRPRATFRASLTGGGILGIVGVMAIVLVRNDGGVVAAYVSFIGGLAIWGWHELAFLTGAIAGPRRRECPPDATTGRRFALATATLVHHEIALAVTAALLLALTWGMPNQTGALAFALLLALRLSAKLNIFAGVPNLSDDLLPAHLAYIKSYFGPRRFTLALALTLTGSAALAAWLGVEIAAATSPGAIVSASLLFALALLGVLEHMFLALPMRDGVLWRWTIPARPAKN